MGAGARTRRQGVLVSQSELIAGLDIGTTKTCVVIAEARPGGTPDIVGEGLVPSSGIQRGVVVDIEKAGQAVRQAAEMAQRVSGVQISSVYAGVVGEHIASVNSKAMVSIPSTQRQIRQADVDRAIEASRVVVLPPEKEIIHAIPRGFSIDGQDGVENPVGMSGAALGVETHIVHGLKTHIENLARAVHHAGLRIERIVLGPHAASRVALSEQEKKLGVVLVDMGGGTTGIAVYTNGSIRHSATLPVGGNNMTQDLAVGLQCSLSEAERVKVERGAAVSVGTEDTFEFTRIGASEPSRLPCSLLVEILEPRVSEMFQMIGEVIEKGGCKGAAPGGLVLVGGASRLRGLTTVGERTLKMPVRRARLAPLGGIGNSISDATHAAALGLALSAAADSHQPAAAPVKGWSGIVAKFKQSWLLGTDDA